MIDLRSYKLTLPGVYPGLNEYMEAERSNRYKAAGMKKDMQRVIGLCIRAQLGKLRIANPVVMHYAWFEPNRRRDRDNIVFARKFIQDALTDCGVLQNDGWNNILWFTDTVFKDAKRPRVEILIVEVEGYDPKRSGMAGAKKAGQDHRKGRT